MARAAKLKVYRTAIGFHDAYLAAPSQKAALKAWGSDKDLFARGAAEIVTDEPLAAEPLASPGTVVKRLRGTAAEQMAALPPDKPRASKRSSPYRPLKLPRAARAKATPPPPPPSRSALEKADATLASTQQRAVASIKDLDRRQAELAKERRTLLAAIATEEEQLTNRRDAEADKYDRCCQSNANASLVDAFRSLSAAPQATRFCHSA